MLYQLSYSHRVRGARDLAHLGRRSQPTPRPTGGSGSGRASARPRRRLSSVTFATLRVFREAQVRFVPGANRGAGDVRGASGSTEGHQGGAE